MAAAGGTDELLRALFAAEPREASDALAFHRAAPRAELPIDRAILGGACADRLAFAFVAGYRAALSVLAPRLDAEEGELASLCATEEGGAHPRAIATTLTSAEGGKLRGVKRFATLGDVAKHLLVVASIGAREGQNVLRVACVPRSRAGVRVLETLETPFCPEARHAVIAFEDVDVAASEVLDGDGWDDLVKPFRTIEDAHVHAAVLASVFVVSGGASEVARESLLACILAVRAIARLDPKRAETHVALAGALRESRRVLEAIDWGHAPADVRARWERDRRLLEVAERARAMRRESAWKALATASPRTTASSTR